MITGKKKIGIVIFIITMVCSAFAEDLYPIKTNNDLFGYINEKGELRLAAKYTKASLFSDNMATVQDVNGAWHSIDESGEILFSYSKNYADISMFSEGLAVITILDKAQKRKQGYINSVGDIVISPKYSYASLFSDGFSVVSLNNTEYFYINTKAEDVFDKNFRVARPFYEGYAYVRIKEVADKTTYRTSVIDMAGNEMYVPKSYEIKSIHDDGYICLEKDDNYYFWNLKTKKIIDVEKGYEAYGLCDGVYTVRSQETNKTGLKNLDGDWILPCTYTGVLTMGDGFASYKQDGERVIINEKGEVLLDTSFYNLNSFNGELASFGTWEHPFPIGYVSKDGQIFYGSDYIEE